MSATNHTTNYELPIFVGSDKPAWLVDWNGAMTAIDTALHQVEGKADQAGTDIGSIESSISTINSTLSSINNAVSQLRLDTNANTGSIHTIQELIGNGTPTTTDKTLIGAINELNSDIQTVDNQFVFTPHNAVITASSVGSIATNDVRTMLNAEKTIMKVYGGVIFSSLNYTGASGDVVVATISNTGLSAGDISEAFDITIGVANGRITSTKDPMANVVKLRFKTDGNIDVIFVATGSIVADYMSLSLPACLYFLTDMGD